MSRRYPIVITRDLAIAKDWVRNHARGSERYGLVASSKAQRLKPHARDVRVNVDPIHWFLDGRQDTRSSYDLEDAATEFQIQGLELDWICVTWDADLRLDTGHGDTTRSVAILGTRQREGSSTTLPPERLPGVPDACPAGMVIFVPRR